MIETAGRHLAATIRKADRLTAEQHEAVTADFRGGWATSFKGRRIMSIRQKIIEALGGSDNSVVDYHYENTKTWQEISDDYQQATIEQGEAIQKMQGNILKIAVACGIKLSFHDGLLLISSEQLEELAKKLRESE